MNIGKRGRPESIPHPVCTVSRRRLYNMLFSLLSQIVAAIVIAVSKIRSRDSFGSLTRSEIVKGDFSVARERSEQLSVAGSLKPFLVVALPDGTIVTARVAGQVSPASL
jgi:hypothetical protein